MNIQLFIILLSSIATCNLGRADTFEETRDANLTAAERLCEYFAGICVLCKTSQYTRHGVGMDDLLLDETLPILNHYCRRPGPR